MKLRNFERWLSKTYKNIYFFFRTQSLLMVKVIKNKRPGPVGLQATKQVHKNFFLSYILSDQVWWCNTKQFLSYSNYYTCKFMKPTHDIINYSTSICPFVSGKYGKEEEKLQKFEYLEKERSFLVKIKNIFHSIWRVITR